MKLPSNLYFYEKNINEMGLGPQDDHYVWVGFLINSHSVILVWVRCFESVCLDKFLRLWQSWDVSSKQFCPQRYTWQWRLPLHKFSTGEKNRLLKCWVWVCAVLWVGIGPESREALAFVYGHFPWYRQGWRMAEYCRMIWRWIDGYLLDNWFG